MQVSPRSDYPVRVRPRGWDEEPAVAGFYDGVYDVTLNHMVTITFVPELGPRSRPLDRGALPADLDAMLADPANAPAHHAATRYVVPVQASESEAASVATSRAAPATC